MECLAFLFYEGVQRAPKMPTNIFTHALDHFLSPGKKTVGIRVYFCEEKSHFLFIVPACGPSDKTVSHKYIIPLLNKIIKKNVKNGSTLKEIQN